MSAHTPGPWHTCFYMNTWAVAPDNDPGHMVASMHNAPVGEANARLIAAAPRMREFIAAIANGVHQSPDSMQRWQESARAILRDVEGKNHG